MGISVEIVQEELEKGYNEKKKDYSFTMKSIGKKLGTDSYGVRNAILALEKLKLVERTSFLSSRKTWRTCFGKQRKGCSKK